MNDRQLLKAVQKSLTPDLLVGRWQKQSHPLEGHCYVAAEALYHLVGPAWKPCCASYQDEGGRATHWWLEHRETGKRLDPTREQYGEELPPYHLGKGSGFLTRKPSRRAQIVLDRVKNL